MLSTVARVSSLEDQVTALLLAFDGATVAVNCTVSPGCKLAVALSSVTPVGCTTGSVTVTLDEAVLPPSAVLTVTFAVPALTPVTLPVSSTVATEVALEVQVTALLEALAGATVAVN